MLQKLIKAITGTAVALAMLVPAPLMAQDTVVDDAELYEYTTQDFDYDFETISDEYEATELTDEEAAALGFAFLLTGVGLIVFAVFAVIMYVYSALAFSAIAKKVGEEPAWYAWVPLLNLWLLAKIAQVPPVSLLLIFIPVVNLIYSLYLMMKVAERRGFPSWVGLLIVIPLLGLVVPGYIAWAEPSKA
jgi:hypothetical protein